MHAAVSRLKQLHDELLVPHRSFDEFGAPRTGQVANVLEPTSAEVVENDNVAASRGQRVC
jgi:hypothetical protein